MCSIFLVNLSLSHLTLLVLNSMYFQTLLVLFYSCKEHLIILLKNTIWEFLILMEEFNPILLIIIVDMFAWVFAVLCICVIISFPLSPGIRLVFSSYIISLPLVVWKLYILFPVSKWLHITLTNCIYFNTYIWNLI